MGQRNAIEIRDLVKGFRVPSHRVDTLKERVLHPLRPVQYRTLEALQGITFDVAEGEFFGIAGRNGCGKTTLLKLVASIYRADAGSIKVSGRLSPFIELGVGFNPNMTARDNVLLNGVMMGLAPREARRRFDEVIEFAELGEFVEMKLKNYSSGMWVRLGFSLMIRADADVLLIDEVLAVGDASFRKKCTDALETLTGQGKTIVFVTHDMSSMQRFCDRALLLEDGQIAEIGAAAEVAERYVEINLPRHRFGVEGDGEAAVDGRMADVWIDDGADARTHSFAPGERIHLNAVIEADLGIEGPAVGFELRNDVGVRVYVSRVREIGGRDGRLEPGARRHLRVSFDNPLAPGRYQVNWILFRNGPARDPVERTTDPAGLTVRGADDRGIVALDPEWSLDDERASDLSRG